MTQSQPLFVEVNLAFLAPPMALAPPTRLCAHCDEALSAARLKAVPNAYACVPCLVAHGDVARIRRHDDYVGKEGEDVSQFYYLSPTPYITRYTARLLAGLTLENIPDDDLTGQTDKNARTSFFSPSL